MKALKTQISHAAEQVLPWAVLVVLLLYTYVKFFEAPYIGFRWASSSGQIALFFTSGNNPTPLQVGDRLLQAGSTNWTDYKQDASKPFIENLQTGDVIELRIERDGREMEIPWIIPGPNPGEINDRLWTEGWLGLAFWVLGTLTFLNLRPKNERWKLLVAFNFLTAIWLTAGSGVSYLHLWGGLHVMRTFVWMSIPIYLHLNWVLPKPLGRLSPRIVWTVYLLAALLAFADLAQLLPSGLYFLGFLFSVTGSLILLVLHAIRQPESRGELRTLIFLAFLSFAPSIVIGILSAVTTLPFAFGALGLLSLPLLPIAYFYAALRRQLGNFELRFNQTLSVYLFTTILVLVFLPLIALLNQIITEAGSGVVIGVTVLIASTLATLFGYGRFKAFVEHAILGVSLPPRDLFELYSEQITTSTSLVGLKETLEKAVLPRLHVRQFAFLQIEKNEIQALHIVGIQANDIPVQNIRSLNFWVIGKYQSPELIDSGKPFAWVRLAVELKIAGGLVGLWLFGRRDPDDFYSQAEINLVQVLANQTAIALSNIVQTQRVSEMYQQDISRHENERMRLALELHDSILNQLATMLLRLDDKSISPQFQEAYDELIDRLREIVSNLRPPMLNYGLKPALDELAESLIERNKNGLVLTLDLRSDECRYSAEVEQHLFRIVQEACENAVRHGLARNINITGELLPDKINLTVTDNGRGFDTGKGFGLATLLANKHFGLAGMLERAEMIGGNVEIYSNSTSGTQIQVRWKPNNAP